MTIAAGIDVGTGAVKAALFRVENGESNWLSRAVLRIRQRDPMELARIAFDAGARRMQNLRRAGRRLRGDHRRRGGRTVSYRPLLLDDLACARRDLPRSGVARRARRRRAARTCHQHRRTRQGPELQDDEPVRVGLRTIPREHRPISRHRAGRDRVACRGRRTLPRSSAAFAPCWPKPTSSIWCRAALPLRTFSRASIYRWPAGFPSFSSRSAPRGAS